MAHNLHFEEGAWRRLHLYVAKADGEISGIGRIEQREGKFYCTEVAIMEQEVSGAHTDIQPEGLTQFLSDVGMSRPETWGQWRLWWHSHAAMGATYSSQDDKTLEMLAIANEEWFLGLVVNKKRDSKLYISTRNPVPLLGTLGEAVLHSALDTELEQEIEDEISRLVRKPAPKETGKVVSVVGGNRWSNYKGKEDDHPIQFNVGEDDQLPFGSGESANGRRATGMTRKQSKRIDHVRRMTGLPDNPDLLMLVSQQFGRCCNCGGSTAWIGTLPHYELVCVLCTDAVSFCTCTRMNGFGIPEQKEMAGWLEKFFAGKVEPDSVVLDPRMWGKAPKAAKRRTSTSRVTTHDPRLETGERQPDGTIHVPGRRRGAVSW